MEGEYDYDILTRSHIFGVWDDKTGTAYKFTVEAISNKEGTEMPHTRVRRNEISVWKGLAAAFVKAGILDESATTAELKCTKKHLEDFRRMIFAPTEPPNDLKAWDASGIRGEYK